MDPIFLPFFNNAPLPPKYQIKKIIKNTGKAVPSANKDGSTKPYGLANTIGIKVIKNRTNMVGQNAKENPNPSKKEPNGDS